MTRADLLALTLDDLAALTNRGTVKRAQRELEAGEVSGQLHEAADGTLTVHWSDGVESVLPAGRTVAEGRCTCAATGLCRHLVRAVLLYQRQTTAAVPQAARSEPWNPGAISDEELARHFKKPVLTRARERFKEGLFVELVRSSKPTARFHVLSCTLRFLVPGDVRYTHCDCAEQSPCSHVPLAVWAFRALEPDKQAGILSTRETALPVPTELLDHLETQFLELAEHGLAGASRAWRDALSRLETACRADDLAWPADILAELIQQYERYTAHDARFGPDHVAELVGELLIRADAIRRPTGAVPQLLVRGTHSDRLTELGSARFIGLGCGVEQQRRSVNLAAYLQDADSGSVVAVSREFLDPEPSATETPRSYRQLAQTPGLKGVSYAALGAGQLLIQGGKRSANHQLILGRSRASVNPQAFAWENLRAPVLAEDFAELRSRLGALPPASLRPRRVADDLHVCPVAGVADVRFIPAEQAIRAVLRDVAGDQALLYHPYTSRGREGSEALLARLEGHGQGLRFVAGQVRLGSGGLLFLPIGLVFQEGSSRSLLQPWIDSWEAPTDRMENATAASGQVLDPLPQYVRQLLAHLGELFLVGLRRAEAALERQWVELARQGEALGFDRLARQVGGLAAALEQKRRSTQWDWRPAGRLALQLASLSRLAYDLGSKG